jgi:hypothetical protein
LFGVAAEAGATPFCGALSDAILRKVLGVKWREFPNHRENSFKDPILTA